MAATSNCIEYDNLFRIGIIGDPGVGKSCLLNRFVDNSFIENYIYTLGADFKVKCIEVNGRVIKLFVHDIRGFEAGRCLQTNGPVDQDRKLRPLHAYVIAFDLTDRESYENVQKHLDEINSLVRPTRPEIKVMVVGCKSDLESRRAVDHAEAQEYCRIRDIPYVETSAKTNTNVEHAFRSLSEWMLTKADLIAELNRHIATLEDERDKLFAMNRDLKRRKIAQLTGLRDELSEAMTMTVQEKVHTYRTAFPFLDKGTLSHRTRDIFNRYDPAGPAST
jgi:Ras-related protein Rab-1A